VTNKNHEHPKFILTLEPLANVDDPIRSLRALLKRALRSYGFRCTSAREELTTTPTIERENTNGN
jgi:hypothetical protein